MIKINVIVKDKTWFKYIKNPEIYLKKKIKKIQKDRFFSNKKYSLSLQLSGEKEIKYLNNKFRKKNKPTDILSFPSETKKNLNNLVASNSKIYLGDIIINIKKMNISSKVLFKNHLNVLFVHGLLHLFGYDHKKNSNFKTMNTIEKKLLKKL
tara:strand:+ start:170 stop:625 length:456 start_codon:yes stop_codon:yes gene_type:complete